jgi:hypothetical protein
MSKGIQVIIIVSADKAHSSVSTSGSIHHTITDNEAQTFNIGDTNLKNAIGNYFGKEPTYAYLHDPTPIWTNPSLYERFGWHEVKITLFVQSATVTEIAAKTEIFAAKILINNSNKRATFDASISTKIQNIVENNWSKTDAIEVGLNFSYKVEFEGCGKAGESTLLYNHLWGQDASESKKVKLEISREVNVDLDSGESVEAVLTASKGVMKVKILYRAYLEGHIAICYHGKKYKGHWYWALPIIGVMNASDLDICKDFTEEIEISFYSNAQVELRNSKGQIKTTFSANNISGVSK